MDKLSPVHVAEIFRTAQMNGAKTVLDVVTPGAGDHIAKLKPILPFVDVFLPNDAEAKLISGIENPSSRLSILNLWESRPALSP